MRVVPIIKSFNSGEVTPLFYGRTDQDHYHSGCKIMRNFVPTVQGPATRRGGTRYTGIVKAAANKTWLATFRFSLFQNYVLEFGDFYIRFWTNRGQLLNTGVPYEVVTPWGVNDLVTAAGTFALRFDQSGDVLWISSANGTFPPYKLSRFGATNWTLVAEPFFDGPFQGVNLQNAITVSASAATGAVTLTASAPVFAASDVGTSFYMESQNPALATSWGSSKAFGANAYCSNNGNVYKTTAGGTSGATPPTHLIGSASDGGILWQYLHSGYGIVQITGFTDSQHVTGNVLTSWLTGAQPSQLPDDVTAAGYGGSTNTKRWSLSLFSSLRGWPVDVKFFRSRLCYIGSNWLCASQSGVYNSFAQQDGPDALATCAIQEQLPVENLSWVAPSSALLVGTPSGERSLQEQSTAKVFQADNIKEQPETKYGSTAIEPVAIAQVVLFVQRTRQRIREMQYDYIKNKYIGEDITVIAEHMFGSGIVQMAWAQEPDCLLWCVLGDGSLASLTYNRDRGVVAWARHYIGGGGIVESIAVIPSPDGAKDDLWMIVRRTINGASVRYVEYMEDRKLYQTGLKNAFYVDAGVTYSGASTMTISGLSHLEGCTVDVLADGSATAPCVVTGGTITLTRAVTTAQIGFNITAIIQPLSIDAGADDGTSQSRMKAVSQLFARFVDTIGGKAGGDLTKLDSLFGIDLTVTVGTPPSLFTGDTQLVFDNGFPDTDADIFIVQDQPLPMTLSALMPRLQVND